MGSKVDLEEDICHLQKEKDLVEAILRQKRIALKHALEKVEEARERYKLHLGNRYFMRRTDMVSLEGWVETHRLLADARDQLDDATESVLRLEGSISYNSEVLERIQRKLNGNRFEHQLGYGKIIPFVRP